MSKLLISRVMAEATARRLRTGRRMSCDTCQIGASDRASTSLMEGDFSGVRAPPVGVLMSSPSSSSPTIDVAGGDMFDPLALVLGLELSPRGGGGGGVRVLLVAAACNSSGTTPPDD